MAVAGVEAPLRRDLDSVPLTGKDTTMMRATRKIRPGVTSPTEMEAGDPSSETMMTIDTKTHGTINAAL